MTKACNWCNEAPVAEGNLWSCKDCSFICPECKKETALEYGSGDCQSCDDCCLEHEEEHVPY